MTRLRLVLFDQAMSRSYKQGNHKLGSAAESHEAIAAAAVDDPLTIDSTGKLLRFLDREGRLIGTLTRRHDVAKRLEAGEPLLHCCVAWKYEVDEQYPHGLASACVVTGDPNDPHNQWMAREIWGKPRQRRPAKSYPVNLVGESQYQAAIRKCREGDPVTLWREPDNPHDPRAVAAKTADGAKIGYLPRDNWLQSVIHDEGCGATCGIKSLYPGSSIAVVLEVTVASDELAEAPYDPPEAPPSRGGWLARIFGA